MNVDKQFLVTLSETEPKVAKAILDKYYDGITIEEFMEEEGLEIDLSNPEIVKKRIASEARRIANEEKISEKRDAFIEEFKMTDDEKDQFEVEFAERVALKSFDMKDIRKHLEKAYREIDSDSEGRKKLEQQETIGKALATGSGKDSATPNTNNAMSKAREEAKAFHKKFNI